MVPFILSSMERYMNVDQLITEMNSKYPFTFLFDVKKALHEAKVHLSRAGKHLAIHNDYKLTAGIPTPA